MKDLRNSSGSSRTPVTALVGAASLVVVSSLYAGLGVSPASAADELSRTGWQMFIPDTPHGPLSTGFDGNGKRPGHGNKEFYVDAEVPAQDDPAWKDAPNTEFIGFDGSVDPQFGGPRASRLTGQKCLTAVDYTYFQTIVTVPTGVTVDQFSVTFSKIDDGARISVYNSAHPQGKIAEGSYVYLGGTGTSDLSSELVAGENRVVITQLDDCPAGNNLGKAEVVMNGSGVAVSDPSPEPTEAPSEEPSEDPSSEPTQAPQERENLLTTTWGDVHIRTPDGLAYNFQATGDYLLTQETGGKGPVLQARQSTSPENPDVSVNTAAAMNVAGDKVEFYLEPKPTIEINDEASDLPTSNLTLPRGGALYASSDGRPDITIIWPDGSYGARVVYPGSYLDIGGARLAGDATYEGVLGNLDGDPSNDMVVRGGAEVAQPAGSTEFQEFGESWQLTPDENLFSDPAPAKESQVPAADDQLTVADLPDADVAKAEKTCTDAGVSDDLALANCTYDVAATGDDTFVASAVTYQQAVEALPSDQQKTVSAFEKPSKDSKKSGGLLSHPLVLGGIALLLLLVLLLVIRATRKGGKA